MAKIIKRDDNAPKQQAFKITQSRFGQAPKVKMNKKEFHDILEAVFIMGENHIIAKVTELLRDNKEVDIDELLGDLQIMQTKTWNSLCRTKIGRTEFNPMYVEDLASKKPINKLFVGGIK